jgi:hypothetical protein
MQARAPLMIEHRLIERMIGIIKRILSQIEKEEKIDPVFVDTTVDFIRTYADRTHHGKEEDILFGKGRKIIRGVGVLDMGPQIARRSTENNPAGRLPNFSSWLEAINSIIRLDAEGLKTATAGQAGR